MDDDVSEVGAVPPDVVGHAVAVQHLADRLAPHLPVGFDATAITKVVAGAMSPPAGVPVSNWIEILVKVIPMIVQVVEVVLAGLNRPAPDPTPKPLP